MLSSLPSVVPFSPQSSSRCSQEHKKQRHFFKKKGNWKENKNKKEKNKKKAKSQFCLRRTRKVDATGPDFGCKFRLRRSPGASENVFRPILARFLVNFHVFSYFVWQCFVWTCFDTARFSDNSRFLRLAYLWVYFIKTRFPFF